MIKIGTIFSGIGASEVAFKSLGLKHEVLFACDNNDIIIPIDYDKEFNNVKNMKTILEKKEYVEKIYSESTRKKNYVMESYNYLHNKKGKTHFFQDVKLLDAVDFKGIDILIGGSPCQSFSSVGFKEGLESTNGTLFYEFCRIVSESQPKVFIFENVRGMINHDKKRTFKTILKSFEELGYSFKWKLINSVTQGIPQKRARLFVVGFKDKKYCDSYEFPEEQDELKFFMQDILLDNLKVGGFKTKNGKSYIDKKYLGFTDVDNRYYLTEKIEKYVMSSGTKSFYQKPEINLSVARTILKTMGNKHRAGVDNYVTTNSKIRMLSPREALRLMGFNDEIELPVSVAQQYKQIGNSMVVDVMAQLITTIKETKVWEEE